MQHVGHRHSDEIHQLRVKIAKLLWTLGEAAAFLEMDPEASTPGTDLYAWMKVNLPNALQAAED